jgi:hypothetical protein
MLTTNIPPRRSQINTERRAFVWNIRVQHPTFWLTPHTWQKYAPLAPTPCSAFRRNPPFGLRSLAGCDSREASAELLGSSRRFARRRSDNRCP